MLICSGGWKVMRQISANDVWRSTASPGTIQPPMAVLHFAHLTWEEVRDLDRTKAVAILPVGGADSTRHRRAHCVSRCDEETLGSAPDRGIPERRLPRGAVRDLDRDGSVPGARPRVAPSVAAPEPALAQRGHPLRTDDFRGR